MSCRKPCKECPWRKENSNQHNLKFRKGVDKMKSIGKNKHACHMINSDIWGYNSQINNDNVCIGQKTLKQTIDY